MLLVAVAVPKRIPFLGCFPGTYRICIEKNGPQKHVAERPVMGRRFVPFAYWGTVIGK